MSEFLEKLEQPELTVTPSVNAVATEVHASAENSVEESANQVNRASQIATNHAATDHAANQTAISKDPSHAAENPVPDRLGAFPSITNEISHSEISQQSASAAKTPKGLVRHRMITGCCIRLSLAILGLSAFDLRGLIDKQGTLDPSLKFTPRAKKVSHLPLHMSSENSIVSEGLRKVTTHANYSDETIGFADEDGNVVLPAIYTEAGDFHDGLAAVKFRGEKDPKTEKYAKKELLKWAFINKLGETVLPPAYHAVGQFQNGVAPVTIDGHGALINKKGITIAVSESDSIPIQFGDFYEVSAKDFRSGVMDNKGKFVVPPIYDRIEKLSQNQTTIHRSGYTRDLTNKNAETSFQYFKVYIDGKCGLVDKTGEKVLPIKYENIASFNKGHAVVLKNFSWGLVDRDCNFIIKPKYTFVSMYDDIIATRDHAGDWKIFDANGKLINTKIDGAITNNTSPWLWNGMAGVVVGDRCGFVNNKGEIAIKPEYDLIQHFSNEEGIVLKDGTWRYVDKTGKELSPITFSEAGPFAEGKADVIAVGPLYGLINASQMEGRKYEIDRNRNDARTGDGAL